MTNPSSSLSASTPISASRSLTAIHTVGSLGSRAGGPSRTVPSLCDQIFANGGFNVHVHTTSNPAFGENRHLEKAVLHEYNTMSTRKWAEALGRSILDAQNFVMRDNIVLHDHGQWLPINRASALISRRLNIPRVVTPRGMLSPWAMRHHRLKKILAWNLFARRDLQSAAVIHATSQLEANELLDLGLRNAIAVIPNGVDDIPSKWIATKKKRQVLFLSRLHHKKGVLELVAAWRTMQMNDWSLVLAGPDEGDLVRQLQLSATDSIHWVGDVDGEAKWRLLSESSLFILPSFSENFGVVVAEALMAGTPVIATHGTPWQSLVKERCGWWVEMSIPSIQRALELAIQRPIEELELMGQRGRSFAKSAFGWPQIAREMAAVYRWILGQGARPECVI